MGPPEPIWPLWTPRCHPYPPVARAAKKPEKKTTATMNKIPATMPTQANTWYSRVLGRPMGSVVSVGSNVAVVGVDSVMVAIPSG